MSLCICYSVDIKPPWGALLLVHTHTLTHTHRHTALCITCVIFHTVSAVPPDASYLHLFFWLKLTWNFKLNAYLLILFASLLHFSFHIFRFCLFSVKVRACAANSLLSGLGKPVDTSTCVKSRFFSEWQQHPQHKWMVATLFPAAYLYHRF